MAREDAARPFLLVNPRSGAGPPTANELLAEARERGIEAVEIGSGSAAELAREAAARGATALGIAGGDGSIGPVAQVALEHELPFVCVPFGTRNHFARDLGIDCDDPVGALDAFRAPERAVDVGTVNGRVFVNNVSLGVYASLVHDPRHKTKNRVVALFRMIPVAVGRGRRPLDLSFEREDASVTERRSALLLLVGNNDYRLATLADFGDRPRLDAGHLHIYVLESVGRGRLVALLARAATGRLEGEREWEDWTTRSLRVDSSRAHVRAAIDGEPAILRAPLEFAVRARALRVLAAPETRDGAAAGPNA